MTADDNSASLRGESMGDLLKRLSSQTTLLVRQEIQLAQAELTQKGRVAVASAGLFGAGALFALGAFGALTATIILALAMVMEGWLAALIVTVVYAVVAAAVLIAGRRKLRDAVPPVPQTVETLKEDVEWTKTRMQSERT